MNEEVQLELTDKNGFFHIDINGKTEAKMTFVFAGPDKIIIDHTEVNEGNNVNPGRERESPTMVLGRVVHWRQVSGKQVPAR